MSTLFEPESEVSYARLLYEHIKDLPVGTVIEHDDPDLPFVLTERNGAVQTARRWLEVEQNRTLISRRGEGYEIARGVEHMEAAGNDLRSAQRKARRAHKRVATVDRQEMNAVEQMRHDDLIFRSAAFAKAANATSRRIDPGDIIRRGGPPQ